MVGDYTSFQMRIYAVPKGQRSTVCEILNEYGLGSEWSDSWSRFSPQWSKKRLKAAIKEGIEFTEHEFRVGNAAELANHLEDCEVTFDMHDDPKYEWMGERYMYHPELGSFSATCDAQGNAVITDHEVANVVEQCKDQGLLLTMKVIDARLGLRYQREFEEAVTNGS